MNKPEAHDGMIPIRDFALTMLNRRGNPVSVSYVYRLIREHKKGGAAPPFNYTEIGNSIYIIKNDNNA